MKHFRWTIKELEEVSTKDFLLTLITERESSVTNVYSPLSKKLQEARRWIESDIFDETEKQAHTVHISNSYGDTYIPVHLNPAEVRAIDTIERICLANKSYHKISATKD